MRLRGADRATGPSCRTELQDRAAGPRTADHRWTTLDHTKAPNDRADLTAQRDFGNVEPVHEPRCGAVVAVICGYVEQTELQDRAAGPSYRTELQDRAPQIIAGQHWITQRRPTIEVHFPSTIARGGAWFFLTRMGCNQGFSDIFKLMV
uniref:Uncharacterized protein n=1 Tax=Knipowitschia caucasica TaxID=637954 RepID=A0AAV2MHU5_KNICA